MSCATRTDPPPPLELDELLAPPAPEDALDELTALELDPDPLELTAFELATLELDAAPPPLAALEL